MIFNSLTSMGIRQQVPHVLWVGYYPGITQDHPGSRDPHPRRASVKRRSPYARRGVRPGASFRHLGARRERFCYLIALLYKLHSYAPIDRAINNRSCSATQAPFDESELLTKILEPPFSLWQTATPSP